MDRAAGKVFPVASPALPSRPTTPVPPRKQFFMFSVFIRKLSRAYGQFQKKSPSRHAQNFKSCPLSFPCFSIFECIFPPRTHLVLPQTSFPDFFSPRADPARQIDSLHPPSAFSPRVRPPGRPLPSPPVPRPSPSFSSCITSRLRKILLFSIFFLDLEIRFRPPNHPAKPRPPPIARHPSGPKSAPASHPFAAPTPPLTARSCPLRLLLDSPPPPRIVEHKH